MKELIKKYDDLSNQYDNIAKQKQNVVKDIVELLQEKINKDSLNLMKPLRIQLSTTNLSTKSNT